MPRLTIKDLLARLDAATGENARLREANDRLQDAVREQADVLRKAHVAPKVLNKTVEYHCPICFDPLSDTDPTLHCSHEICRKCCLLHFSTSVTCPLCRQEATPKELWRFRHPTLSKYWGLLKGSSWPKLGDVILLTTATRTLTGRHVITSDEKKTIVIIYHLTEWELHLDDIREIFTMQHIADSLPPRDDGLRRTILNE
jgi:hypothetical protein